MTTITFDDGRTVELDEWKAWCFALVAILSALHYNNRQLIMGRYEDRIWAAWSDLDWMLDHLEGIQMALNGHVVHDPREMRREAVNN